MQLGGIEAWTFVDRDIEILPKPVDHIGEKRSRDKDLLFHG
jgi:hypothetical protein